MWLSFYHERISKQVWSKIECLRENTEKYKTLSVPIEKEVTHIDKDGNESVVIICFKIKFTDNAKLMASSLSNLIEGIRKVECKHCDSFLEYESAKDNLIKYKCLSSNKYYLNKLDEKIKKRFQNTFKFSDNDKN